MDVFSEAMSSIRAIVEAFAERLPFIAGGIIVFILFLLLAKPVAGLVRRLVQRTSLSDNAALLFGRLARWVMILVGFLLATTFIFPTIKPGQLVELLGVGSVAIGFAFRDILQNFLAGILLLLTEPFRVGDQIIVGGYEGTVKQIETRATTIRTYDGRQVVIPNADLFTDSVTVNTANEKRRSQYDVGIGYGDDIAKAKEVMLGAVRSIDEILSDPAPEVLTVDLAGSSVNLRIRWWTEPQRAEVIRTQDKVLSAVAEALTDAGIDMPFPTRVVLFHDQTEEIDGVRSQQREGWPVSPDGDDPEPLKIASVLRQIGKNMKEEQGGNAQSKE